MEVNFCEVPRGGTFLHYPKADVVSATANPWNSTAPLHQLTSNSRWRPEMISRAAKRVNRYMQVGYLSGRPFGLILVPRGVDSGQIPEVLESVVECVSMSGSKNLQLTHFSFVKDSAPITQFAAIAQWFAEAYSGGIETLTIDVDWKFIQTAKEIWRQAQLSGASARLTIL